MMLEIRWHGRGGQGAITVSKVLAMAALGEGLHVQSFPEYGPERGGAPIKAFNRISDEIIRLHSGVYEPDLVAVLDETLLETEDVTAGLSDGGTLVVNTTDSIEGVRSRTGFPGAVIAIDAEGIAEETNKFPNVPLLGALMNAIEAASLQNVEAALHEQLSEKVGEEVLTLNMRALRRGYDEAERAEALRGREAEELASRVRETSGGSGRGRLRSYQELPEGAVVVKEIREDHKTGGWRQEKPIVDEALCVNCLLCWINCPEPAILVEGGKMKGYDYDYCKGCGICFATCPTEAITMIRESEPAPPLGAYNSRMEGTPAAEKGASHGSPA